MKLNLINSVFFALLLFSPSFALDGKSSQVDKTGSDNPRILQEDGEVIEFTKEEIESSEDIQYLLNFGIRSVLRQALRDKAINRCSGFRHTINSVQSEFFEGLYYRFNVNLSDGVSTSINALFSVWYEPDMKLRRIGVLQYTVL